MKHAPYYIAVLLLVMMSLFIYEAHETRAELAALRGSAAEIAAAEREDNYLWLHATTTDDWVGLDGWHHGVTSEQRQGQTLRDWFDHHNQIVDAKIASKPLSFKPREVH